MTNLEKLLTDGLAAGYAGKSGSTSISRGVFVGEHFKGKQSAYFREPKLYLDEWFGTLRGGGQELVLDGQEKATRLYAGGTVNPEELARLGITQEQVSDELKKAITEQGQKTRLHDDCIPEPDGDWQYSYQILKQLGEIDLTIGLESITYRGQLVFAHGVLNSPVK